MAFGGSLPQINLGVQDHSARVALFHYQNSICDVLGCLISTTYFISLGLPLQRFKIQLPDADWRPLPSQEKKNSENNKEVKKEQDQDLTVKEMDSEKITSPALEKIQELISELQNSLTSDSKNGVASPNFSTLATKLENPAEKIISTTKVSASSEEDNLKNSKTSPAIVQIQELIFDLQNSLK
ncbi:hypothetical protein TNCV_4711131 [Trichonephila clavipes]|uniref:Uncharacterized protein n=1 Tax=Trichonephila clavipes TaxID=2585209 RepID=A0A8X6RTI5_TRICX|nr:hypothetical protein TNCV_4711131 [Trichonephila clavipes]